VSTGEKCHANQFFLTGIGFPYEKKWIRHKKKVKSLTMHCRVFDEIHRRLRGVAMLSNFDEK
jgi:hypothetical protein